MEEWKDITGYEGLYLVSNLGNIKSVKTGKLKSKCDNGRGYQVVNLYKNGKQKMHTVHRLVATAFIENPENLPEVNHKDENKKNNSIENLEWCTTEYNQKYGTRLQRLSKSNIENTSKNKKVICVETGVIYKGAREAARKLSKNTHSGITYACRNNSTAYGYHWKYVGGGQCAN